MITVEIRTNGPDLEQVAKRLAGPVRQRFIELLADVTFDTMRELAPVRSGFMRDSVSEFIGEGEARVGPTDPKALFVEYGTRPHVIYPVNASCLAFFAGGRMVFAAYVNHPGTKPRPFVRYAAEEAQRRAPEVWEQAFKEVGQ
ncbi:hypothetical protein MUP79_04875 [Candidatus Bathyarchaeota archaeon]|nr:hypothetical protein [Candidatus Bathyarchaeota archaeon]